MGSISQNFFDLFFLLKSTVSSEIIGTSGVNSLIFDVIKSEQIIVQKLIKENMENAYQTTVPLKVEMGLGENWLIAH